MSHTHILHSRICSHDNDDIFTVIKTMNCYQNILVYLVMSHSGILESVAFFLQVLVAPVEPKRAAHLLPSVNHSTSFHAMTRSMVVLVNVLLWQVTLVAPVLFPSLLSFLLEVTLVNSGKTKTRWKAGECNIQYSYLGASSVDETMHSQWICIDNTGIFFQCQEIHGCKCTFRHLLFKCLAVVRRWVRK